MKVIAISGSSGTGKTTMSELFELLLGEENCCKISGDDLHLWKRGHENWRKYTHLNPAANDIQLGEIQLSQLKNGKSIMRRRYDHDTGNFLPEVEIFSREWIICEGLHALHGNMPQMADFRIFIETEKDLKVDWKVKRDINKRGYTKQQVLDTIAARESDEILYIIPQKKFANVIVKFERLHGKVNMSYTCLDHDYENLMSKIKKLYDSINDFAALCNKLSLNDSLVQGRGGNVSVKIDDMIVVTSSGYSMSDVGMSQGFCVCDLTKEISTKDEDEFLQSLRNSKISGDSYPSMELGLHRKMSQKFVVHTHPIHLNTILCCQESQKILKSIFSDLRYEHVDYANPGLSLFMSCNDDCNVLMLQNHGLIVSGQSENDVYLLTEEIDRRCREWIVDNSGSFIDFEMKNEKKHLFPDAVIFPDDMAFTSYQILHNIFQTGLTPRFLSDDDVRYIKGMKAEKDRLNESHRANGGNR